MRTPVRIPAFAIGAVLALIFGWAVFPSLLYEKLEQPLQFSHGLHTSDEIGLVCGDCHTFDESGRFSGIPAIGSCGICHEEALGDSADERRLVEEFLQTDREVPWLVYARQPDNVRFPHSVHVTLGEIECGRCHGDHGVTTALRPLERNRVSGYSRDIWGRSLSRFVSTPEPRMKMGDCCACHRESGVDQACLDCHR
jgi:hypothetical protein